MSDREQIVEALARIARATDARDWNTIRTTFTEEATGYGRTGVDRIVEVMQAHLGGCGPTQHLLGNHRVTVDGDSARSLTYGRVYHQGAAGKAGSFFECMGEYDDRWVRTSFGWRLAYRNFDMHIALGDFTVLQPAA